MLLTTALEFIYRFAFVLTIKRNNLSRFNNVEKGFIFETIQFIMYYRKL